MSPLTAKVLYTKHVHKKRKTWQDGYLSIASQNSKNGSGKLYDEDGMQISSARIPESQSIDADSEG